MKHGSGTSRIVIGALLFVLIVGVQTISFAHAFEHDGAAPGHKACATCISLSQLAAVAIDTGGTLTPVVIRPLHVSLYAATTSFRETQTPNQRGPPAPS